MFDPNKLKNEDAYKKNWFFSVFTFMAEKLLHLCSPASDVHLHSDVQVVKEGSD